VNKGNLLAGADKASYYKLPRLPACDRSVAGRPDKFLVDRKVSRNKNLFRGKIEFFQLKKI